MAQLSQKLDKTLVVAFLFDLVKLAQSSWVLEKEFDGPLQEIISTGAFEEKHYRTLMQLLYSDVLSNRNNGEAWLFALLKAEMDGNTKVPKAEIEQIFHGLTTAQSWETRGVYISLVDKLLLYQKSKLPSSAGGDEAKLAGPFTVLNELLSRVVAAQEKHESNLMHMFDIVFRLLAIPARSVRATTTTPAMADSLHELFLLGEVFVPSYLLRSVNMSILLHLFNNLPSPSRAEVKRVLLSLMTEKAQSKALLDSIGGADFFKSLLTSKDPAVVLHSAKFILEIYKTERKSAYEELMQHIEANPSLKANPYAQMSWLLVNKK